MHCQVQKALCGTPGLWYDGHALRGAALGRCTPSQHLSCHVLHTQTKLEHTGRAVSARASNVHACTYDFPVRAPVRLAASSRLKCLVPGLSAACSCTTMACF